MSEISDQIQTLVPEYVRSLQVYQAGKPIDELTREKGLTRISKLAKRLDSGEESQAGGAVSLTSNKINAVLMPIFFIVGIIGAWWSYLDSKQYFLRQRTKRLVRFRFNYRSNR